VSEDEWTETRGKSLGTVAVQLADIALVQSVVLGFHLVAHTTGAMLRRPDQRRAGAGQPSGTDL